MNRKVFIYGGIGLAVFIFFIVLLLLLLNRGQQTNSNTPDVNRSPTKSIIQNAEITGVDDSLPEDYSGAVDLEKQTNESQLENAPATFLYNQLPHEQAEFSMTGDFVDGGGGIVKFTVTSKGSSSAAKEIALTWMQSLGLKKETIDTFDITYN